jgi:radical SAM superfamily enzyme YgiQ (UPF0313 family)
MRFAADWHAFAPPMGLMSLKAFAETDPSVSVTLWNGQSPERRDLEDLSRIARNVLPDVVGVTAATMTWYDALRCIRRLREELPSIHIVVGGPHVTLFPEETLAQPEIDSIVLGEGERTLSELVRCLAHGGEPHGIDGLWFRTPAGIVRNRPRAWERDLDAFPPPDWSSPGHVAHLPIDAAGPAAVILTSRGCPFRCTFCTRLDGPHRSRSVSNVVDEVLRVRDLGFRSVDFFDDVFNVSRKWVLALCDELVRRGARIPWACRCRVHPMDEEMVAAMARAGCTRVHLGVESADEANLRAIQKGTTPEQCRHALGLCRRHGITTLAYYILGFPGETVEDARRTIDFALELDAEFAQFYNLVPFPGTPLYASALQDPSFGGDYFREFALRPTPNLEWRPWQTTMSAAELRKVFHEAYRRYYLRPRYLARATTRVASITDLVNKIRAVKVIAKLCFL